jgi:glutathione synthase
VVNDPKSVINAPEKMFVLDYARFMPPTLVARKIEDVRAFQQSTARW